MSPEMNRKVTIAGGGLAGLALGIALRKHEVPVQVLESGYYPRHRVCGEFMTGISPQLLENLNIADCFEGAQYLTETAWYDQGSLVRNYQLPQQAIGISRYVLDERLVTRLRKFGGTVVENHRVTELDSPGLIEATGHNARSGGMVGLKGHWRGLDMNSDLELHIGHGAYIGVSRVEDDYINVCGLFSRLAKGSFKSPLERFHETLRLHRLHHLSERLENAAFRKGSLAAVSGLTYGTPSGNPENSLGDRSGLIPPFTGNGMTIALESAETVLPALLDYAQGKSTWEMYLRQSNATLKSRFNRRRKLSNGIHPLIINPSWNRITVNLAKLYLLPFGILYRLTH